MSTPIVSLLAETVAAHARSILRDPCIPVTGVDVRPAFALALETLECEGLIPAAAPELREISGGLAELRAELLLSALDLRNKARAQGWETLPEGCEHRHDAIVETIRAIDRIAARTTPRPSLGQRIEVLNSALKRHGVDLGAGTAEALVKALASLDDANGGVA